jgi:serine/threonine protein kinase
MGAVYKARQKSLDRVVALKILPPGLGGDSLMSPAAFARRFTYEAQAMARLNHQNIVTLYEFGTRAPQGGANLIVQTLYFFLMEFVDGPSLRQIIRGKGLDPKGALAIVPQICSALEYAHERNIVHRDIKPENILLTRSGQVKIADFGLAKLIDNSASETSPVSVSESLGLAATTIAGTPAYMAPEQAHGNVVDHRADIYALGVVFYQLITGELPGGQLIPPSEKAQTDVRLDQVVLRALEQRPDKRYQNATELRTHVETVLRETSTAGETPALSPVHGPKAPRRRWPFLIAVALAIAAFPAIAFFAMRKDGRLSASSQPSLAAQAGRPRVTGEVRPDFFPIAPNSTYLRTDASDIVIDPVIINLSTLSTPVYPGDTILIQRVGFICYNEGSPDVASSIGAIFSASNALLPTEKLYRVADAIGAHALEFISPNTGVARLPTDVPQDFLIDDAIAGENRHFSSVKVLVPPNAKYLFIGVHDNVFHDNSDPNSDFGAMVSLVPEPASRP